MLLQHYPSRSDYKRYPVVYIPGFASSSRSLHEMSLELSKATDVFIVELPGYDNSTEPLPENYSLDEFIGALSVLLQSRIKEKFVLGGYSMGGRIALQYAIRHQNELAGLILESTSAGIDDKEERELRKLEDDRLAEFILSHTAREFAEHWVKLPIFQSLASVDPTKQQLNFTEKLECRKEALLFSLQHFGQGIMQPVTSNLKDLSLPVLLLTGSLDTKYLSVNRKMAQLLPENTLCEVSGSGHNIHLEKTGEFVNLVLSFLNQLKEQS